MLLQWHVYGAMGADSEEALIEKLLFKLNLKGLTGNAEEVNYVWN